MCQHQPPCPPADAPDHAAARTVAAHPEQGWSLLCNGVLSFDDTGELLPNGRVVAPRRPTDRPDAGTGREAAQVRPAPIRRPAVRLPATAPAAA